MQKVILVFMLFSLLACGSSSDNEKQIVATSSVKQTTQTSQEKLPPPIPINQYLASYKVALIGNSHSYGILETLRPVLEHYSGNSNVEVRALAFGYTDELIKDSKLIDELNSGQWSHLIIQGQKYSQSGNYVYSTNATEQFISIAKSLNIMPILFPEHPQKGDPLEGERVYELHKSIAQNQPSCVAPIGLVWNKAIAKLGSQYFYSSDGNHAAAYGFMSTSLTLAQIITGEIVDSDEQQIINSVPSDVQAELARIVSQTLAENAPCN
ncbi:hypothetical protein [Pseudoalteromonas phenolica]|nr:hypothetical protein [Pseudoalteromonas phenolica]